MGKAMNTEDQSNLSSLRPGDPVIISDYYGIGWSRRKILSEVVRLTKTQVIVKSPHGGGKEMRFILSTGRAYDAPSSRFSSRPSISVPTENDLAEIAHFNNLDALVDIFCKGDAYRFKTKLNYKQAEAMLKAFHDNATQ